MSQRLDYLINVYLPSLKARCQVTHQVGLKFQMRRWKAFFFLQLPQAKRLWEHSAYLAQRSIDVEKHLAVLQALKPIFGGWPAQLAQVAAHAETLRDMLSRPCPVRLWGKCKI